MNRSIATAAVLLAGTVIVSAQTIVPCTNTDPAADVNGACDAAPSTTTAPGQATTDTLNPGTFGIDENSTSAIPQPPVPQGMPPLVVPNDPLGHALDQNPLGGSNLNRPSGINGTIGSPSIQ